MNNIIKFNESKLNKKEIGGKGYSIAKMYSNLSKLNIKIPNGFILSTNCYIDFLNYNNISINSNNIVNEILNSKFSEFYINSINTHLHEIGSNKKYAVRSSCPLEDGIDNSFAGQYDTYLNISGLNNILDFIKKCYASLFNERAISYKKRNNITSTPIIAVVIQEIVSCDKGSAGVAFSIDTETNFDKVILINSAFGFGETVVGGNVVPDEFIIHKEKLTIIEKKIASKNKKMICNDNGTKIINTTNEEKFKQSLPDNFILVLANYVKKLELFFCEVYNKKLYIDIEWGYDGTNIFILQARPITTFNKINKFIKYNLVNKETPILEGIAVGDKIGSGKVKIINNINEEFNEGDILVTDITSPDWEILMKKSAGIITNKGGRTSHCAIVARELGIPAIVGTFNATKILNVNQEITVSCCEGTVGFIYNRILDYNKEEFVLDKLPNIKTKIKLNIGSPDMAFKYAQLPNNGVGLAREEFIFANYIKIHPLALLNFEKNSEEVKKEIKDIINIRNPTDYFVEQLSYGIGKIAGAFYPNDVIVRFSDFKSNEYKKMIGGELFEEDEENPMIGFRGASRYYSKEFSKAFELECKAVHKVVNEMRMDNLIVMIPFCRTPDECKKIVKIIRNSGLDKIKIYLMCEIPSNVICAKEFSEYIDGVSIGSNDLLQLSLGIDRDSEYLANIATPNDITLKRLISSAINEYHNNGKKVGICGDAPSTYPDFTKFLIENSIDSISVTPDALFNVIKNLKE